MATQSSDAPEPVKLVDLDNLKILFRGITQKREAIWRSPSGRYISDQTYPSWLAETEEKTGEKYELVPLERAVMEALSGPAALMDREAVHDWLSHLRGAFRWQD